MDANYVFLCGMAWSRFGEEDAGHELIRALDSPDCNLRVLARAMLEQGKGNSRALIGEAVLTREISAEIGTICGFESDSKPKLKELGLEVWFHPASA